MISSLHPFISQLGLVLIKIICLLVAIAYYTISERKIMASIQRRRGPNVVGFWGLLQPLADGFKLIAKEMIIPSHSNSRIFVVAPLVILTLGLLTWSIIPFGCSDYSENCSVSTAVRSLSFSVPKKNDFSALVFDLLSGFLFGLSFATSRYAALFDIAMSSVAFYDLTAMSFIANLIYVLTYLGYAFLLPFIVFRQAYHLCLVRYMTGVWLREVTWFIWAARLILFELVFLSIPCPRNEHYLFGKGMNCVANQLPQLSSFTELWEMLPEICNCLGLDGGLWISREIFFYWIAAVFAFFYLAFNAKRVLSYVRPEEPPASQLILVPQLFSNASPDFTEFNLLLETNNISDLQYGVLFVLALSSLTVYGLIIAGWASNSKYAFLGALRSAAQMISYEVAINLVILPAIFLAGSLNFTKIVIAQLCTGWFAFPLAPASLIFFISMIAETNRTPFDLPEAEAELVAGYNVEYSSIIFAMFFLAEYGNMILMSLLKTLLFFGGWQFSNAVSATSASFFSAKGLVFCFLFVLVRATFPRYRYDQLMDIGWKTFLPVSTGFLFFTVGCSVFFGSVPHSNVLINLSIFSPSTLRSAS